LPPCLLVGPATVGAGLSETNDGFEWECAVCTADAGPAVPPSHSAGDHEMRDYYVDTNAPRPSPNQTPYLTPYLGLQARLSQIWINRWTVLLLLILVRVLLMIASTDTSLSSARREALSACTSVETVGTTMASMPHYMARGVNSMTASGITKAVSGLESMVGLTVTGVLPMAQRVLRTESTRSLAA